MGHDGSKALVVAEAAGAGVEGFGGGGGYFHPLTLKASCNADGGPPALSFRRYRCQLQLLLTSVSTRFKPEKYK